MKPPVGFLCRVPGLHAKWFHMHFKVLKRPGETFCFFNRPVMEIDDPAGWGESWAVIEVFAGEVGEEDGGEFRIFEEPFRGLFWADNKAITDGDCALKGFIPL